MPGKIKLLFLSTTNSARSQMAEAFLRKYAGEQVDTHSAGFVPSGIDPDARGVMQEVGLSLDGQSAKDVRVYLGKAHFGYLITVCDTANKDCPAGYMGISHRLHWSIDDPGKFTGTAQERLAKYRTVRDQIDQLVRDFLATEINNPG